MANNGTQIYADSTSGISLHADVYPVLGLAKSGDYYDIGYVCKNGHGKINKWSFKKPVNISQVAPVTDAQIKQVHCGLTPVTLSYLKSNCNHYDGTATTYDTETVINQVAEWSYRPPTLYCRLTDFDDYSHIASVSDRNWKNYSIPIDTLQSFVDSDASATTENLDFVVDKTFYQMRSFDVSIDGTSAGFINGADSNMLPLTYAAGDSFISGEYWRIAYAIRVPYANGGSESTQWELFIGRKVLETESSASINQQYLPPDMSTNTLLVQRLIYNYQSKNVRSFTMIPCLVKNATMGFSAITSSALRSYVRIPYNAEIYAMPSGTAAITLTITAATPDIPQIGNVRGLATYNGWVIGIVDGDETPVSPYYRQLHHLVIVKETAITAAQSFVVEGSYTRFTNTSATATTTTTLSGSRNVSAGQTFTKGGITYYGAILAGGYGMSADITRFETN